jgi:hypothetical protein
MKVFPALDYLGTKPSLFINGQISYRTTLGGIISIILSLCLIIGTSYFVRLLFSRETFTVETSEEYYTDSYADWSDRQLTITLLDKLGAPFPDSSRLFGVTSLWWKFVEYTKPDNTLGIEMQMVPVNLEKCNLTKHFSDPSLYSYYVNFLSTSYCVAPNQNLNLTKPYGFPNSASMWFWIHRCKNSTIKKDCYPPEKIEQDLMNANVALTFKNFYFDHKKKENTGTPYIFSDAPIASSTNYRRIRYTLNEVEYKIDDGLIFPNTEQYNYVTFNNLRESIDFRTDPVVPGSLVGISFDMHVLKQKIKKNYYKFQNMLADLGGLYKALLTIITFFNGYFSDRFYFNEIIEKNLGSMSEKNYTSNTVTPMPKIELGNSNTNIINLGQSQNNLLNLNINKTIMGNKFNTIRQLDNTPEKKKKNSFSIIKMQESKFTTPSKDDKKTTINLIKLKSREIVTPVWCCSAKKTSGKNLRMHQKFKNFVKKQLDISCIFEKLNNFDKISLILTGSENKQLLESCVNPNFYLDSNDSKVIPMFEFEEVKYRVLTGLSNFTLNYFGAENK